MRMQTTVRNITTCKPFCATPNSSVETVAKIMADSNRREVPICYGGKTVGVVTIQDIVCRVIAHGLEPSDTPAKTIMSPYPIVVTEAFNVEGARYDEPRTTRRMGIQPRSI